MCSITAKNHSAMRPPIAAPRRESERPRAKDTDAILGELDFLHETAHGKRDIPLW
jgi:predicted secreted protein